jgi:nucleoside-diphosphate-sugar epimerase
MRLFVAGATGVLGRRIVAECVDRGHEVVGLTRDDRGDALIRQRGGEPHRGDVLDRDSLVDGAAGADVVIHAATKIPTDQNPDDEDWALNDRVRREGAENLLSTAATVGTDRFILQSIVWVARQPDGTRFDETAPPNPDRSTRSALDAERLVRDGADEHGFEPVVLRGGWFYAPDTAHTRQLGERLLAARMPIIGRGLLGRRDATLSFVHVDDAGRAFADAVEGTATGTFHVVDDEPTTYAGFLRAFADRLEAPSPRRLPAWLARLFADNDLIRLLTCPMPTTNERLREAFDWTPQYPTIDEGLDQVVARWRDCGLLRDSGEGYAWTET